MKSLDGWSGGWTVAKSDPGRYDLLRFRSEMGVPVMIEEQDRRRAGFRRGVEVRMADGQSWSLPRPSPEDADPELQANMRAIFEAEDEAERLRGELALTILLLSRNYRLTAKEYQRILCYAPDDPALAEMQRAVHAMVEDYARSFHPQPPSNPRTEDGANPRATRLRRMIGPPSSPKRPLFGRSPRFR